MKLTNPSDDELDEAFAEHVAGWKKRMDYVAARPAWDMGGGMWWANGSGNFTKYADSVLPYLDKAANIKDGGYWRVVSNDLGVSVEINYEHYPVADTFPRACVIALLRANGVEVEFTG